MTAKTDQEVAEETAKKLIIYEGPNKEKFFTLELVPFCETDSQKFYYITHSTGDGGKGFIGDRELYRLLNGHYEGLDY